MTDSAFALLRSTTRGRLMLLGLLGIFLGSLVSDQWTKDYMHKKLLVVEDPSDPEIYRGASEAVFKVGKEDPGPSDLALFFQLQWKYSRNRGAAFSFLADTPDQFRRPFFNVVMVLANILLFFYFRSSTPNQHLTRIGLSFIYAGAIGNFIDRWQRDYVIDFIDTRWNLFGWQHDFAIFNVADVSINIGLGFVVLEMLLEWREEKRKLAGASTEEA